MAGPVQALTISSPGSREGYKGPLGDAGWGLSWLDFLVYSVEYVIVVVAMVAMTVVEFVYIASLYVTEQKIAFAQMQDPALEAAFPWSLVVLLGFIGLMMFAVVGQTRLGERPVPLQLAAATGLTAAVVGVAGLTLWLDSSAVYYMILTTIIMVPATGFFFKTDQAKKGYMMIGMTLLAYAASWNVPEGYSWADKRALFLLLWVGFLGASMAAKQQRHLKIDIARKLCPPAWLPRFNGVSYTVAAVFTGLMAYLGYIYLFHPSYGRFWVETIPGEIPDWLKVASIPIALALITLRFGARGLTLLIWGDRYATAAAPSPFDADPIELVGDDSDDIDPSGKDAELEVGDDAEDGPRDEPVPDPEPEKDGAASSADSGDVSSAGKSEAPGASAVSEDKKGSQGRKKGGSKGKKSRKKRSGRK